MTSARIDRWLHAVRLAPSRTSATEACASGRVRVDGVVVKPAAKVGVGSRVEVRTRDGVRHVEVVRVIDRRVGAPVAAGCYSETVVADPPASPDGTGPMPPVGRRERGSGRPTKRDRREIDRLRGRRR